MSEVAKMETVLHLLTRAASAAKQPPPYIASDFQPQEPLGKALQDAMSALEEGGSDVVPWRNPLYIRVGDLLLRRISPELLRSSGDEKGCLHGFFASPPVPVAWLLIVLCEALTWSGAAMAQQVCMLLRPMVADSQSLAQALQDVSMHFDQDDQVARVAAALCLAPQRSANALHKLTPEWMTPSHLYPCICKALSLSCSSASCQLWRPFVSRLLSMGRGEDVAASWCSAELHRIRSKAPDAGSSDGHWLKSISSSAVETLVTAVMLWVAGAQEHQSCTASEGQQVMENILSSWEESGALRHLLTHTLLLRRSYSSNVADLLAAVLERAGLLETALEGVCSSWAEPLFIHRTHVKQQEYVMEFILAALRRLKLEASSPSFSFLLKGVSNHLEMSKPVVRRQGMRVGEALSLLVGMPIEFDELRDYDAATKDIGADDGEEKVAPEVDESPPEPAVDWGDPDMELPISAEGMEIQQQLLQHELERQTQQQQQQRQQQDHPAHGPTATDDDELIPYSSDSRPVIEPLYLHQAIERLNETGDEGSLESQRSCLQALPDVLGRAPADVDMLINPLLTSLLFLENRFNFGDFDLLRKRAMIAACCVRPAAAAVSLSGRLYDQSTSHGCKNDILWVMMESARSLSGRVGKADRATAASLGPASSPATLEQTGKIQREWGKRASRRKSTIRNRFNAAAPTFIYSILGGFAVTRDQEELWGHSGSAGLLARIITALAVFVECAELAPTAPAFAQDVMEFAWAFRSSPNVEVQSAVLHALAMGSAVPSAGPLPGGIEGERWLQHAIKDTEYRFS